MGRGRAGLCSGTGTGNHFQAWRVRLKLFMQKEINVLVNGGLGRRAEYWSGIGRLGLYLGGQDYVQVVGMKAYL